MNSNDDDDIAVICCICEHVEKDLERVIECVSCNQSVHFKCKKLRGNAIARARSKPFYCSPECFNLHDQQHKKKEGFDVLVEEIRALGQSVREARHESATVRIAIEKSQHQIAEIKETNKHIEASQEFLAAKFDFLSKGFEDFREEIALLRSENHELKLEIEECKGKNVALNRRLEGLELEVDQLNRKGLSRNAIVLGLPTADNENLREAIVALANAVTCNLTNEEIVSVKRLNGNNTQRDAPVLIVFESETKKEELFYKKRVHGVLKASDIGDLYRGSIKTVTLRDELTSFGKDLLKESRQLQDELGFKYVWPGRDGKVLMKKCDGSKVVKICTKGELLVMLESKNKRNLNASSSSSIIVSSPKRMQRSN